MLVERRVHPRQRTYLGASVEFNSGYSMLDGLIRNASRSGIRLAMPNTVAVPYETYLHVKKTKQRLPMRLIWRTEEACGFAFVIEPGNVVSLPSTPLGNLYSMWADQTGGVVLEYALLGAMSAVLTIYEARTVGAKLSGIFQTISSALQ